MIYFQDDVDELAGSVAGKGTLINELIRDHFANDEETLRRELDKADLKLNQIKAKLQRKLEERKAKEAQTSEQKEAFNESTRLAKQAQYEREAPLREWKQLFKDKAITYNEYYSKRDMDGWKLEDIKKAINALAMKEELG